MAYLVLIGGGTCSGKTTLASNLADAIPNCSPVLLRQDNYYLDLSSLSEDLIRRHNFDSPDSIDVDLFKSDLRTLLDGKPVPLHHYDYSSHTRKVEDGQVGPGEILIVEGIFALCFPEINELAHLKIFVDADPDTRLARRLRRDVAERGFGVEEILEQYFDTVKPMHEKYIAPSMISADWSIDTTNDLDHARLEDLIQQILNGLKTCGNPK